MSNTPIQFWKDKWLDPPKDPKTDFSGKTVLLTGATSGIGLQAAIKLVRLGAKELIIGSRDVAKGEDAKRQILKNAEKPADVHILPLEMGRFASVKEFAELVSKRFKKLDMVVLNAGVQMSRFETTADGWEADLQINAISTILLARLLLPGLVTSHSESFTPLLSFTTSSVYEEVKFTDVEMEGNLLEHFNLKESFSSLQQYFVAKLFLEYGVKELADSMPRDSKGAPKVIITRTCPGSTASGLSRHYKENSIIRIVAVPVEMVFCRSPEVASRTIVTALTLPVTAHGKMWKNDQYWKDTPILDSEAAVKIQRKVLGELTDIYKTQGLGGEM